MIIPRIKIVLKKFFRNKLNYIICLLIAFCFSFSIMISSLTYSAKEYYENDIFNFVSYRIFSISNPQNKESLIKTLNNMPEIESVFDSYGYMSPWELPSFYNYFSDTKTPSIWLLGIGGSIDANNNQKINLTNKLEMVCPSMYIPYTQNGVPIKDKEIDLTSYVGKTLTIKYIDSNNPKEYEVKLVGLYDNDKIGKNYDMCYMNYQALEKINKEVLNLPKTNIYYELKNIIYEESVTNKLQNIGYYPDPVIFLNRMPAIDSLNMLVYISYGIFGVVAIIILALVYYKILKDKENNMLNKLLGYSNKNSLFNYVIDALLLFIFSIILLFVFVFLLLKIFKVIIPKYYTSFKNIPLLISYSSLIKTICLIFILSLLLNIIIFIFGQKREKHNV